jgi:hypothetical protein
MIGALVAVDIPAQECTHQVAVRTSSDLPGGESFFFIPIEKKTPNSERPFCLNEKLCIGLFILILSVFVLSVFSVFTILSLLFLLEISRLVFA